MAVAGSYSTLPTGQRVWHGPAPAGPPGPFNSAGVPGLNWTQGSGTASYGHLPGTPSMYQAYQAANPWQPPPIPPGLYNPSRDIEASEGKKGYEQTISGLERQNTNGQNDYGTSVAVQKEKEGNETQAYNEGLARLAESYRKLGARQTDQASGAGVLYGGAVLASGLARAHNEGVTREADQVRRNEQLTADQNAMAALGRGETERSGALIESLANARQNETSFGTNIRTLEGTEAADEHGYDAPTAPGQKAIQWSKKPLVRAKQLAQLKSEGRA